MSDEGDGAKFVVIGGGTGSFTLLSGLKKYARHITALVNMADDGGSTGQLRDELGVLPPGDVRQCLVALSESPKTRDLFNYRFEEGTFKGHAFGNLFLTALEKMTGSFAEAVEVASEVLKIQGNVEPVTLDSVRLGMRWPDKKVLLEGERVIDADIFKHDPRSAELFLEPAAQVNPAALQAIVEADIVVIAPGDLYTSLGSLLIIDGIGEALESTAAKIVYVCNLVTKHGQTDGFTVGDHVAEIERFIGQNVVDYVIYNDAKPTAEAAERYQEEGAYTVDYDRRQLTESHYEAIGADLLGQTIVHSGNGDLPQVTRGFIRHNADAVARQLMRIYFA